MIPVILIAILLVIGVGAFLYNGFGLRVKDTYNYFDPAGKQTVYFYRLSYKDDEDKKAALAYVREKYVKENPKAVDVIEDVPPEEFKYTEVPVKLTKTYELKWYGQSDYLDTISSWISLLCFVCVGIGGLACAGFAIAAHNPYSRTAEKVSYERQFDELELRQTNLYNALSGAAENKIKEVTSTAYIIYDVGSLTTAINDYNAEVIDFKEKLYHKKLDTENLWMNWYVNTSFKEIKGYNPNATNYKEILGENLKIFVPNI